MSLSNDEFIVSFAVVNAEPTRKSNHIDLIFGRPEILYLRREPTAHEIPVLRSTLQRWQPALDRGQLTNLAIGYTFGQSPVSRGLNVCDQEHALLENRSDRSLSGSLAHIEGSTYLGPGKPVTSQFSHSNSVNLDARPSELLALRPGIAQPSLDPLLDERSLELGHGADDLEHQAAGWRAQIEVVSEADKRDS